MPTDVLSVGTTETGVKSNPQRTVLVIQNLDTVNTDYIWVSDQPGRALATGIRIAANGGSLTLRRSKGDEPEKAWFIVATTAATPVRVMRLFGRWTEPTEEPSPQEPEAPQDAPKMKKEKWVDRGYR